MKLRSVVAVLFFLVVRQAPAQEEISLEQVISLALEKNYDVRIARAVSESSLTDSKYVNAAFLPTINAVGTTLWNEGDQTLRFMDETRNIDGPVRSNNLSASAQLVWTLFDGTKMFATRERIARLAEQGELVVKDQMINTIADVIANYYNIVRQKQQLLAIQEQMGVSEERVKLAEKKLQVGTGIKPELLQAQVDLNQQRTQVIQQETIISQLKEQLNALVGLQLPVAYDVADTIVIDLNLSQGDSFQNVESTNYTLQAARKNLDISSLAIRERRADYLPTLDFNAAYNYNRTENTKLLNPFGTVFNLNNGFNYGFTVTLPILNGFNTRRLTQQATIEFNRQQLLYEQQRNNINVSLRNAFVNYDNAKKILIIEQETIGAAKENVFIALESFKRGVTTFIELRTAQQSLADAYNRLITARYNAKLAETELLRLNGSLLK
jgi:outer membrane protein TolC